MWGCFSVGLDLRPGGEVFPTHVGVFLSLLFQTYRKGSLPHACGGVSEEAASADWSSPSSPRMWGCFFRYSFQCCADTVFPTRVGCFSMSVFSYKFSEQASRKEELVRPIHRTRQDWVSSGQRSRWTGSQKLWSALSRTLA